MTAAQAKPSKKANRLGDFTDADLHKELVERGAVFAAITDHDLLKEMDSRDLTTHCSECADRDDDQESEMVEDGSALEEAVARLKRGEIAEGIFQLERAIPRLDGLASQIQRHYGSAAR